MLTLEPEEEEEEEVEEDAALFGTLREKVDPAKTEIVAMDCHINDREFAEAAAERLVQMMEAQR